MEMKSIAHFVAELLAPHGYVTRDIEEDGDLSIVRFARRRPDGAEAMAGAVSFGNSITTLPADEIEQLVRIRTLEAVRAATREPALRA